MPPRRRPQSVRRIVRDHLELIERNREYGTAQWATLLQLGLQDVSLPAFRDALYRARRRLRAAQAGATDVRRQARGIAVGSKTTVNGPGTLPRGGNPPSPSRPLREGKDLVGKSPERLLELGVVERQRDFREIVRSTKDDEIF